MRQRSVACVYFYAMVAVEFMFIYCFFEKISTLFCAAFKTEIMGVSFTFDISQNKKGVRRTLQHERKFNTTQKHQTIRFVCFSCILRFRDHRTLKLSTDSDKFAFHGISTELSDIDFFMSTVRFWPIVFCILHNMKLDDIVIFICNSIGFLLLFFKSEHLFSVAC